MENKEKLINEVKNGRTSTWLELANKYGIRPNGNNDQKKKAANDIWRNYLKKEEKKENLKNFQPKRLILDIETSYNIVKSWRIGHKIFLDYDNIIQENAIICVAYKWYGEDTSTVLTWNKGNDMDLISQLMPVLNEADELVGHNLERFDLPFILTQAVKYGHTILPRYKVSDTLKIAKRYYRFPNNKLDTIAQFLGVGKKVEHRGLPMWDDVILRNDSAALDEMCIYCVGDIIVTEKVFDKLQSVCASPTNHAVANGYGKHTCPECGNTNATLLKTNITSAGTITKTLQCNTCNTVYVVNNLNFKKYYE